MAGVPWQTIRLPEETSRILSDAPSVVMAGTIDDLLALATEGAPPTQAHEIACEIPRRPQVIEAIIRQVPEGILVNYPDPYMRQRDPDCLVIGDSRPRNVKRFRDRFGFEFETLRQQTFDWLATQKLCAFPFLASGEFKPVEALAICPANVAFFALGLALGRGILTNEHVPEDFSPRAMIYIAPPFRHTHFEGKQVVVDNPREMIHERFSYSLHLHSQSKVENAGVLLTFREQRPELAEALDDSFSFQGSQPPMAQIGG